MKKAYNTPDVEFVEFESVVSTNGSSVHDGSEASCSCTAHIGVDYTKLCVSVQRRYRYG